MKRLHDEPFRPFRIHLSDGTTLDVANAGMVIVGETSAVLPTLFVVEPEGFRLAKRWRTIAIDHITQFSDLSEPLNHKPRRRRR